MNGIIKHVSTKSVYWAFAGVLVTVILTHLSTLSISPLPWIDEVQIIEMGRNGILDSAPKWSLLVPDKGACAWSFYYVGGLVQEIACRVSGGGVGPRLLSLVGLFFAALLVFRVARNKEISPAIACGVSLLYLVDPVVTQSVRGARVDVWTTVCTLGSVLLLGRLGDEKGKDRSVLFCVGALSVLQLFIWASSLLQLPLVLIEVWLLAERRNWKITSILMWAAFGFFGALSALLLLSLPLLAHWPDVYDHFLVLAERNLTQSFSENMVALKGCLTKTPFLTMLGGFALVSVRKNWRYAIFLALCFVFVLKTRLYVHRFVHLTPYFVIAIGIALNSFAENRVLRNLTACFLCLGILVGVAYSVVARNLTEQLVRPARCHAALVDALRAEVGAQGTLVYVDSFQTYYAARELGWSQYRMSWGEWWKEGNAQLVMARVDWFLTEGVSAAQEADLQRMGFAFVKEIRIPGQIGGRAVSLMKRLGRPIGYGPYRLFRRVGAGHDEHR